MNNRFFFDRRAKPERRINKDQRLNPRLDLSHKRRRKSDERRASKRTTRDDFYASRTKFGHRTGNRLSDKH